MERPFPGGLHVLGHGLRHRGLAPVVPSEAGGRRTARDEEDAGGRVERESPGAAEPRCGQDHVLQVLALVLGYSRVVKRGHRRVIGQHAVQQRGAAPV